MDIYKYIVFIEFGQERIHTFEDYIIHKAEAKRIGLPAVRAGSTLRGRCFGESVSLGLNSDPEADAALLKAGLILGNGEAA